MGNTSIIYSHKWTVNWVMNCVILNSPSCIYISQVLTVLAQRFECSNCSPLLHTFLNSPTGWIGKFVVVSYGEPSSWVTWYGAVPVVTPSFTAGSTALARAELDHSSWQRSSHRLASAAAKSVCFIAVRPLKAYGWWRPGARLAASFCKSFHE